MAKLFSQKWKIDAEGNYFVVADSLMDADESFDVREIEKDLSLEYGAHPVGEPAVVIELTQEEVQALKDVYYHPYYHHYSKYELLRELEKKKMDKLRDIVSKVF